MAEVKPHEFDRLLRSSASLPHVMLFFGPDRGLVSERAQKAAERTGISLSDPFSVIQLDPSDIQKNYGLLADEVNAIGLFGGDRLIWLKGAGNEKPVVDAFSAVVDNMPDHTWLIVEAGDLKKTSALRKAASGRNVTAVPCYADDARGVNELIDEVLSAEGKRISSAARARLAANIGGDRIASRGEINKLVLYCLQEPVIEEHHVTDIIGDASATSIDDAIDNLLRGNRTGMVQAVQKVLGSKVPIYQLLNAVIRQFQQLDTLRGEMDKSDLSPSQAVSEFGKQIFFKRKPIVTDALNVWTSPKLARELNRLQSTVLQCQKNPAIAESIALQLLLSLAVQSGNSRQRQSS